MNVMQGKVKILEEKMGEQELDSHNPVIKSLAYQKKDKDIMRYQLVFQEMINLMNTKKTYMYGAEKSEAARFIAKNSNSVLKILKNIFSNDNSKRE
ncbi:MAG: hypothetical protein EU544_00635 [Promethearchaeota archaeon]|nr:MAG: hypothetical protein EU544_00635 [Candidatus Lokiarchaeota archaeon]